MDSKDVEEIFKGVLTDESEESVNSSFPGPTPPPPPTPTHPHASPQATGMIILFKAAAIYSFYISLNYIIILYKYIFLFSIIRDLKNKSIIQKNRITSSMLLINAILFLVGQGNLVGRGPIHSNLPSPVTFPSASPYNSEYSK